MYELLLGVQQLLHLTHLYATNSQIMLLLFRSCKHLKLHCVLIQVQKRTLPSTTNTFARLTCSSIYLHDFRTAFRENTVVPQTLPYLEEKLKIIFEQHRQWCDILTDVSELMGWSLVALAQEYGFGNGLEKWVTAWLKKVQNLSLWHNKSPRIFSFSIS